MSDPRRARHSHPHAFAGLNPLERAGLALHFPAAVHSWFSVS